jgi:transposase, IS5 family
MSTPRQLSFFDLATRYQALSQHGDPLEALAVHVPWEAFRPTLEAVLHPSKREKGGRPPFDAVLMFKILVLQTLYNLSDDQTEYQVRDRLSFMRFLGLDLDQRIPDAKTIWLFREALTQAQVVEILFEQCEAYLATHGLQPRRGQWIDASLVPVPIQRNSREDNATIKAGDCPAEWDEQPNKRRQKDTEARWTKKPGASHYEDKNHGNVDKQHKLIRQYAVTDAAMHDSQVLGDVLLPAEAGRDIWADSAYRSEEIETQLKTKHLRSKIHDKWSRHKALTAQQHTRNRARSRIRARVEHVFGHQVTAMGGKLIRTIGLARARAKIGLKNLTYTFQRFLILTMPRTVQEG